MMKADTVHVTDTTHIGVSESVELIYKPSRKHQTSHP